MALLEGPIHWRIDMWIRFFRVSDGSTVKTQHFTNFKYAIEYAKQWLAQNPDMDWEGM